MGNRIDRFPVEKGNDTVSHARNNPKPNRKSLFWSWWFNMHM